MVPAAAAAAAAAAAEIGVIGVIPQNNACARTRVCAPICVGVHHPPADIFVLYDAGLAKGRQE